MPCRSGAKEMEANIWVWIIGLIAIVAILVSSWHLFVTPSNWKWYRILMGGEWIKVETHFAPGIPMAGYTCWEKRAKAWVGRGCGSYSEVIATEDYTRKK